MCCAAHMYVFVTLTGVLRPNQGQEAQRGQKKRQGDLLGDDHDESNVGRTGGGVDESRWSREMRVGCDDV